MTVKTKTQAEWCAMMEGTDACFAPVLPFTDAPNHPANKARGVYMEVDGFNQPAPAPRFSRTPSAVAHGMRDKGADTDEVMKSAGMADNDIARLRKNGILS